MEVDVRNTSGQVVDHVEVSDLLFNAPIYEALVHQALVRQRANARQGTHSTKTRSEARGGGRKPWRQKYTGRARQGSIRSPLWRHGGVAFGPKPRSYRQDIPVRMRRQALRSILTSKLANGDLVIIDSFGLEKPRTKDVVATLQNLEVNSPALLVTAEPEENLIRSAHNVQRVKTLPARYMNVGDLLAHRKLVITLDAVRSAEELWAKSGRKAER
ncbi:MAG: 50S ribosomal protein L4 [Chloroflexi bacterium]|nr:50S ribosomal protein L4 [Chloroflexota bacterium]